MCHGLAKAEIVLILRVDKGERSGEGGGDWICFSPSGKSNELDLGRVPRDSINISEAGRCLRKKGLFRRGFFLISEGTIC